jgi:MoaA/NifB/PqqE/SkfB family radical SAM enzyme
MVKETRFEPGLKLARHKELGQYLLGEFVPPINIEISPSGTCNAACPWCFYRQEQGTIKGLDGTMFRESRMEGLVQEFAGMGVKSISWTGGGEPSMHPSFPKFVEMAHWAGLKQGIFTNALKIPQYNPSLFEWIRVSKTNNPWNEDSLSILRQCKTLGLCINYRGSEDDELVSETLKIVERLDKIKESPKHTTYLQVRPALKILGDKTIVKTPAIEHPLLKITEYKFLGSNSEREYAECEAFHFAPFIWPDGDVDVCGYHRKDKAFLLGNLYEQGEKGRFSYIMKNAPRKIPVANSCQICCKLNAMNSMINMMRHLEDIDFP